MNNPIRILLLDDDQFDRQLVQIALEKEPGRFHVTEASSRAEFENEFASGEFDLVLTDFDVRGYQGLQVLELVKAKHANIPVVILTGSGSEEVAVEAMKNGAADYVVKSPKHIQHISKTLTEIVEKFNLLAEHKKTEEQLVKLSRIQNEILDTAAIWINTLDAAGNVTFWNQAAECISGYSREEVLGSGKIWEWLYPDPNYRAQIFTKAQDIIYKGVRAENFETTIRDKDGVEKIISWHSNNLLDENKQIVGSIALGADVTRQRKTEFDLQASEERFRSLFENSTIGLYRTTPSGKIELANPTIIRLLGYSSFEELANRNLEKDGYHPNYSRSDFHTHLEMEGEIRGLEAAWTRKDGTVVFVRESARAIRSADGKILYYEGTVEDISERKRAEEALNKRDTILEAVGFAAEEFLKTTALEISIQQVIEKLGQVSGVSRVYIFENQPSSEGEIFTSQRYEWVSAGIIPQIDNPDLQNFPLRAWGFGRWADVLPQSNIICDLVQDMPESERVVLQAQDILSILIAPIFVGDTWWGFIGFDDCQTERVWSGAEIEALKVAAGTLGAAIQRKESEEALRIAEAKYRALIEQSPVVVYTSTINGISTTTFVSSQIKTLTGYSAEEWMADPLLWSKRLHPEDRARVLAEESQQFRTGGERTKEYRLIRKDGQVVWVRSVSTVVTNQVGNPLFLQGVEIDITEYKKAEAQVKLQFKRLMALHRIDLAITSSLDLHATLNVLLDELVTQFGVDAVNILIFNTHTLMIEGTARRGFRSTAFNRSRMRVGEGFAGKVALERRSLVITDLLAEIAAQEPISQLLSNLKRAASLENFVSYCAVPLVAKGQLKGVLETFHRSKLDLDPDWHTFLESLAALVAIAMDNSTLFAELQQTNVELTLAYETTLEGLTRAIDMRAREAEGHTERVSELTVNLARALGIGDADIVHIRRGALLHDIGKMGVNESLLLKPGTYTAEECQRMRQHITYGMELLSPIAFLRQAMDIPRYHHEKWDGTGYPNGLKGEEIPLAARIFTVVDVWEALATDHPYRAAWSAEEAMTYIRDQAGKHFDPQVVQAFIKLMTEKQNGPGEEPGK